MIVITIVIVIIFVIAVIPVVVISVPIIVPVIVGFFNLSGNGVDFKFVLCAVGGEFHLINAVVQIILPVGKGGLIQSQLGQHQLFGLFQTDIAVFAVIVVLIHGNGGSVQAANLHGSANFFCNVLQKIVVGILGALGELHHNVGGVSIHFVAEVTAVIDFLHQLGCHIIALSALKSGVTGENLFAVVVQAFQADNPALAVIFHFDFRIHAEKDRSCTCSGGTGSSGGGGACCGRIICGYAARQHRKAEDCGSGHQGGFLQGGLFHSRFSSHMIFLIGFSSACFSVPA